MPKASKAAFYAVHKGHTPGVYASWPDCEQQIKGFPKAQHKKFSTEAEAKAFVEFGFSADRVAGSPTRSSITRSRGQPSSPLKSPMDKTSKKLGKETVKYPDIPDESGWDVVYTDGACRGNGKKEGAIAGIGVWWGENDPRNFAERCPGDQTNNRAELIAIIRVLETAPIGRRPLLIKTDSSYSISCIRDWISSWCERNWKTADGKPVKNKEVIIYLAALLDKRGEKGQRVELQHVRGHAGIPGNEGADVLAGLGASMTVKPEQDWSMKLENLHKEDTSGLARLGASVYVGSEWDPFKDNDILNKERKDRPAPRNSQSVQDLKKDDAKDTGKNSRVEFEFDAEDLLSDEELARMELDGFD